MKKLILMVALIGTFGFVSIEANTIEKENVISELNTLVDEITFQELPAAVQDAFTDTYSKESVAKVIKHDDQTYEIHVELEEGIKALKYNSNGELLKEWSVE
ncbi:PepSY-like domain-containing protein [Mangrovivirga sp. M17]|uniref:PepSY-like domain-containing protein n=1 Tax=Mangrovivirga halotolerans TaxID=2993936 RepID=A0ABT3RLW4_9BACT|nr:PepSY-like domain-containing protein [Mangrovivirga halotolerans]MCX2742808.1 PepSY-like domain-containing protein [Mangrovivirga halotolerans]